MAGIVAALVVFCAFLSFGAVVVYRRLQSEADKESEQGERGVRSGSQRKVGVAEKWESPEVQDFFKLKEEGPEAQIEEGLPGRTPASERKLRVNESVKLH
jgi:hypothetical protein